MQVIRCLGSVLGTASGITVLLFTLVFALDGDPDTGDPALELRRTKAQVETPWSPGQGYPLGNWQNCSRLTCCYPGSLTAASPSFKVGWGGGRWFPHLCCLGYCPSAPPVER